MKFSIVNVLIYTLSAITEIESAKILVIIPYSGKSHNIFIQPIIEEIALRGHDVTYYCALPSGKNVTNIKEIKLNNTLYEFLHTFDFELMRKIGGAPIFGFPGFFFMGTQISDRCLNDPVLAELIKSDEKFDLVLLETFFGQESFIAFGHKFQAPVITWNAFSTYYSIDEYIGNPFGTAYVPTFELPYTDKMTFFQRVHNVLRTLIFYSTNNLFYLPKQDSIMRKYFNYPGSENIPPIAEMLQNVSLTIINSQVSVDYPRPWVPTVIPVGGAHISLNRKPLPQDLKEFMDNAKDGVVYVSFGSVVPSEQLPDGMKQAFINVFRKLKQNFIWKLSVDSLPGLSHNVKLSKWFPQHEILAHPNCKAFITHGGLLSQEEAVYFGVPLIGVPFFGDQYMNVLRSVDRGFAIHLDQYNITEESLLWAINEAVYTPSYRENIRKYSEIFRDNLVHPTKNAAYWIEYVLRHKGAPHMQSEGRKLPYYKYLLLDVIAFMLLFTILFVFIIYKVIRTIFVKICSLTHKRSPTVDLRKKNK